jgi:hypothetical protein
MKVLIFNILEEQDPTAGIIGGYINRIQVEIEEPEENIYALEQNIEKSIKNFYDTYIVERVF